MFFVLVKNKYTFFIYESTTKFVVSEHLELLRNKKYEIVIELFKRSGFNINPSSELLSVKGTFSNIVKQIFCRILNFLNNTLN